MADPTLVNGQITDSVTQSNVHVLGTAPAMALSNLYQTISQSIGLAAQNAAAAQQQANILYQAATAQAVSVILGGSTAAKLDTGNDLAQQIAQIKATIESFPRGEDKEDAGSA